MVVITIASRTTLRASVGRLAAHGSGQGHQGPAELATQASRQREGWRGLADDDLEQDPVHVNIRSLYSCQYSDSCIHINTTCVIFTTDLNKIVFYRRAFTISHGHYHVAALLIGTRQRVGGLALAYGAQGKLPGAATAASIADVVSAALSAAAKRG